MNPLYDTKLVWHCRNRHTKICKEKHKFCNGDRCRDYRPNPGSYNDKSLRKDFK
jgi:hypothetical protein